MKNGCNRMDDDPPISHEEYLELLLIRERVKKERSHALPRKYYLDPELCVKVHKDELK